MRRSGLASALTLGVLLLGAVAAQAATPIEASSVATGRGHSCAVLTSGQVVCWGNNFYGELGNGTHTPSKTPVPVSGLTDAESISANGEYTTCAIRTGGQALCWGQNDHGQLGDTSTTERLTPVNVNGLTDAHSIAVGWTHTCAAREGGAALCWGYPVNGVLGIGSAVADVKTPTAVKGVGGTGTLGGIVQMAVGSTHSCARGESGQVYCWGDNFFGRLGDDTTLNKDVPVAVHDMADAEFISAGYASSCAIRESGQALCWGSNAQGRLGDGTETERHVPAAVSGVGDAEQMSGKLSHMCAVRASGETVCWGANASGQLGDGTETDSLTPVVVVAGSGGSGGSTPAPPAPAAPAPVVASVPTGPAKSGAGKSKSGRKGGYGKCLAQANRVFRKAIKSAKRKRGKPRGKALKAAKKKKQRLVGKCKRRFRKGKGKRAGKRRKSRTKCKGNSKRCAKGRGR